MELSRRGWETLISIDAVGGAPFWQSTVAGVEQSLRGVPERAVALVGHSGAGALLPAIAAAIRHPVAVSVFVDAGLPAPGRSRLQAMADEGPGGAAFATELTAILDAGGRYPEWTDEELAPLIPDPGRRHQLLAEMRPRGRDFWTEPLPRVNASHHAPSVYLLFSETYRTAAERADAMGWPLRNLSAGHFHHLVDESSVADAILSLLADVASSQAETSARA